MWLKAFHNYTLITFIHFVFISSNTNQYTSNIMKLEIQINQKWKISNTQYNLKMNKACSTKSFFQASLYKIFFFNTRNFNVGCNFWNLYNDSIMSLPLPTEKTRPLVCFCEITIYIFELWSWITINWICIFIFFLFSSIFHLAKHIVVPVNVINYSVNIFKDR